MTHSTLTTLIDRLERPIMTETSVIQWGSPVPNFGDISKARVATLGLNPSNREFLDDDGVELRGPSRRFHTLNSLGLNSWSDADSNHLRMIIESCRTYFLRNPYDRWFRRLNHILTGANVSYNEMANIACHLDLVPYATREKWTALTSRQRTLLLAASNDTLGLLLRDSQIRVIILNGKAVVDGFQEICGTRLGEVNMPSWSLPRQSNAHVAGIAYTGLIDSIAGVTLGHRLLVLGFNHNIQSSYGVTTKVVNSIRGWISQNVSEFLQ